MSSTKRQAANGPEGERERAGKIRRRDDAASPKLKDMPYMAWLRGGDGSPAGHNEKDAEWLDMCFLDLFQDLAAQARQTKELLSFCPADEAGSPTGKRAKAAFKNVQRANEEIWATMGGALQRVNELYHSIQEQNITLLPALTKDFAQGQLPPLWHSERQSGDLRNPERKAWYWKSDIMALDTDYVIELFKACPVKDAADFGEYLEPLVAGAYEKLGQYFNPLLPFDAEDDSKLSKTLSQKTRRLYRILAHCPGPATRRACATFIVHLMVSLAVQHVCDESDFMGSARCSMYMDLFAILKDDIVSKTRLSSIPKVNRSIASKAKLDTVPTLRRDIASNTRPVTSSDPTDYYFDFAALRRRIWFEWKGSSCLDEDEDNHEGPDSCFPAFVKDSLQYIHRAAHREVRTRTYVAVGSHLPVELADLVVEAALAAEEVPLEPDIYDENHALREAYRCNCAEEPSAA